MLQRPSSLTNNLIGGTTSGAGNTIAFNGGRGVFEGSGPGNGYNNSFLGNSIFANGGLGIDLGGDGVTPNDIGDADTGPNQLQNYPVIASASRRTPVPTSSSTPSMTVNGSLNSAPSTAFRLEFFASPACDPSGNGEGKLYLGSSSVTTDGSGNVIFTVTVPVWAPPGSIVTATATDPAGNTSEFASCVTPTSGPGPTAHVSLSPTSDTAQVGMTHTVTATATDAGPRPPRTRSSGSR